MNFFEQLFSLVKNGQVTIVAKVKDGAMTVTITPLIKEGKTIPPLIVQNCTNPVEADLHFFEEAAKLLPMYDMAKENIKITDAVTKAEEDKRKAKTEKKKPTQTSSTANKPLTDEEKEEIGLDEDEDDTDGDTPNDSQSISTKEIPKVEEKPAQPSLF